MATAKKIQLEEELSFFEEDHEQPIPPDNVVAYNELRSCADLHRMHASGKLEIQPDFQREVVWNVNEQARFIDSLVKQLPIPSMCFSLDSQTKEWKVIDGLQRMHTITSFLGTGDWMIAPADDIHHLLRGKTNNQLQNGSSDEKLLYSSVQDLSIPITVIRCSYADDLHMRYLFTIFNRLNSGGVRLNNQEIRNCIYSGQFNDMLKSVDRECRPWRTVQGRIWGKMNRFRSVEVLLRMLAFGASLESYNGNLAGYLNDYMLRASRAQESTLKSTRERIERAAGLAAVVLESLGHGKKSLTFVEGILVGCYSNLESAPDPQDLSARDWANVRAERFLKQPAFDVGARYALSSTQTVKERLKQAISAFA